MSRVNMMFLLILLLSVYAVIVCGLDNGLSLTPSMGWNSWNAYHCTVNETIIRTTADYMILTGLYKHGYQFVNVDDCWAQPGPTGKLSPDNVTFPNGMYHLSEYVHSKGLKFGLYSDAGTQTCAGRPGSLGHETINAVDLAAWGIDYLKYDDCYNEGLPPVPRYRAMSEALNATGRAIVFSACDGNDNPPSASWAPPLANSWRTTDDIQPNWKSIMSNLHNNDQFWKLAAPGYAQAQQRQTQQTHMQTLNELTNDADMLEVGNGQLTYDEEVSHFSLWCLIKSPLILGNDLSVMSARTLSILTNDEAISVSQDPLAQQGHLIRATNVNSSEIWAGPLVNGTFAVILLNVHNTQSLDITVLWSDLGLHNEQKVIIRDLWQHRDIGTFVANYTATQVQPHASRLLKIIPINADYPVKEYKLRLKRNH